MVKQIVGGAITLILGGTTYLVSQSNVVSNLSRNTGMSQQQAQQYINNIPKSDMTSLTSAGQFYVSDGNSILNQAQTINCGEYTYQWQSSSLTCIQGQTQLQEVGSGEVTLGNCYEDLGTDLGNAAASKINECIQDIDALDADDALPISAAVGAGSSTADNISTNEYNKSVLQSALQSNQSR